MREHMYILQGYVVVIGSYSLQACTTQARKYVCIHECMHVCMHGFNFFQDSHVNAYTDTCLCFRTQNMHATLVQATCICFWTHLHQARAQCLYNIVYLLILLGSIKPCEGCVCLFVKVNENVPAFSKWVNVSGFEHKRLLSVYALSAFT
jgi:hypothetical protein